ncbi:hypothetical protein JRQ81_002245, partial [Phrynocephalus forsythii]
LIEKFNGILTRMIKAYVAENPNDWDWIFHKRALVTAHFELLLGRKVKRPLDLLRVNWEDPQS